MDQSTPPQHNAITTSLLDFVPDKNGVWAGNKGGFKKKKEGKFRIGVQMTPQLFFFGANPRKRLTTLGSLKRIELFFFIYFFGFYQLGWDPQSSPTKLGRLDLY